MIKWLLITTLAFTPAIYAAEPSALLKCSAIYDGVKRLACFDELVKADQRIADQNSTKKLDADEIKSKNWTRSISQSKIDDSETVTLETDSKNSVPGRFKREATPTLMIRCLEGKTSFYISFDGLFVSDTSNYGQLTIRVDKEKPFVQKTTVSSSNKALGLWNGSTSIPFIKKLFDKETLLVQVTPFNESPITLSFDISGLQNEIEPLRKACKW